MYSDSIIEEVVWVFCLFVGFFELPDNFNIFINMHLVQILDKLTKKKRYML